MTLAARLLVVLRAHEGGAFADLAALPGGERSDCVAFAARVVERIETLVDDASGIDFSWNVSGPLSDLDFFPEGRDRR